MISVVIPTIPPRAELLERAVRSVRAQTQGAELIIEVDHNGDGAAVTRQHGLERVATKWVAFLDDDDEFLPEHLGLLYACARETGADYVYPWYHVVNRAGQRSKADPMPAFFGKPWDNDQPHQTTITTLVRTELAKKVGFQDGPGPDPNGGRVIVGGEDYRFTLGCMFEGAKIIHLPQRTWLWHHHGKNTSGLPGRWKE